MWREQGFHALLHADSVVDVLTRLMDDAILVHPRKILRVVFPRPAGERVETSGWHQDFPEIQGSGRTVTLWAPLAACDPTTGVLAVVPRSHRQGLFPLQLSDGPAGWEVPLADHYEVHTGPMQPGDILVFSAYTVHRGMPNCSGGFRISVDCRYQPVSEPICQTCLDLIDEPYGWDDVYADWDAEDLRYYWRRYPLNIVPYDERWDEWREEVALAAGRSNDPRARRSLEIVREYSAWIESRVEAEVLLRKLGA